MAESLFERIGGGPALDAAVDLFYRKVLSDQSISHFFDDADMEGQRAKQKAFLAMVFGGPNEYSGKDLRAAHKPLVDRSLNDSHFDTVPGHLQATLTELGIPGETVAEVIGLAAGPRSEVLNR